MAGTIMVVGYGPGVSSAVAERFGAAGFSVALVARTKARLDAGVAALQAKGIKAAAITADAGNPEAMHDAISHVRKELGPIGALHWNAYGGSAGDLIDAAAGEAADVFDVAIVGLLAAVQAALPDLKADGKGAVLVTNGAFGDLNPGIDKAAVRSKVMGLALGNAAKHKLVGLLSARLAAEGVFVGEVMIAGAVAGTAYAAGAGGIDPARIADQFWQLYSERSEIYARVSYAPAASIAAST